MTIQNGSSAAMGSSANIAWRVWRTIPKGWFAWLAPIRDALIGGVSDSFAWAYGLISYAKAQTRLATAYGVWLDILCYDFLGLTLTRSGAADDAFRRVIKATVLQERVTRQGMINAITTLTGQAPWIFEPWNTYDTGGYGCAQFGYGTGQGGYGNMGLPAQVFMQVHRGGPSGIPNVAGYTDSPGGYGQGAVEYVGLTTEQNGITNQTIETAINLTKPTGSTVWLAFD